MKKIINITMLLILIACKAQSPIVNIANAHSTEANAYNKDVDNLLPQFEGTYVYTNGATILKFVLVNKINQFNGKYFEDLIIGEYQYIENGVEKINTLASINTIFYDQCIQHNIGGNGLIKKTTRPFCPECGVDEKRLSIYMSDPLRHMYGTLVLRKILVGSQVALKVQIRKTSSEIWLAGNPPPAINDFNVPSGEYILIKQ